MAIFRKEADMQKWLSDELETACGLADLIINDDYIADFEAKTKEEIRFKASFESCIKALYMNEVISIDENISETKGEGLKPDFTLYAPDWEGIVLVELKNAKGATREAGTELSAYACEIKTYMPLLSDGDLYNVIISPVWPTLIKHHIFHDIFWSQRNVICLEPVEVSGKIKLRVVDIPTLLAADTAMKISDQHLMGVHMCLYDDEYRQNASNNVRFDGYVPQMKAALSVMASKGNQKKGHGFSFLWKDKAHYSLAPYFYTTVSVSPLSLVERYLHGIKALEELPKMKRKLVKLLAEHPPTGHTAAHIDSTIEVSEDFLQKICKVRYENFMEWDSLREEMLARGELIAFQGWGVFDEEFTKRLIREYKEGNIQCSNLCPNLGLETVSGFIDSNYEFLQAGWFVGGFDETPCVDESDYADLM